MKDEDLDIPSQKRMHAQYRCEKIRQQVLTGFQSKVAASHIEDLDAFSTFARESTLESFGEPCRVCMCMCRS